MCKYGDFAEVKIAPQKHYFPTGVPEIAGSHAHRVNVDRCLAPLVEMLNIYGIETVACCCGHGKSSHSYIKISAQNVKLVAMKDDLTIHLKFPYPGKKLESS